MPNFTETLLAEIAELRATVAKLDLQLNPPAPPPAPPHDSRPAPKEWTHEERQAWVAKDAEERRAKEKDRYDAARVGCEPGTFRDPMGLVRYEQTGTIVPDAQVQAARDAARNRFDAAAREEDLAWRKAAGIEIRHGADNAGD